MSLSMQDHIYVHIYTCMYKYIYTRICELPELRIRNRGIRQPFGRGSYSMPKAWLAPWLSFQVRAAKFMAISHESKPKTAAKARPWPIHSHAPRGMTWGA